MRGLCLLSLIFLSVPGLAKEAFWVKILSLRPTQFAAGMSVVHDKEVKIRKMSGAQLSAALVGDPVPVVEGPDGALYLIDRHHLARALWQAGEKEIFVRVIWKWRGKDPKLFWEELEQRGWVYLYDQFGVGPHEPIELPRDVRSLADDPYRSLAKYVRAKGGFKKIQGKMKKPFQEFTWANYFRTRITLHDLHADPEGSLERAMALAASEEAKELPGFNGNSPCDEVTKAAGQE